MSTEAIVEQPTEVVTTDSTSVPEQEDIYQEVVDVDDEALPQETDMAGAEPANGAQKRIKQLAAQRKAAEEARIKAEVEREYYKGLAEGRTATQPEPQAPIQKPAAYAPPVAPILDDFESIDEYDRARDSYILQMAEHNIMKRFQEQQQQVAAQKRAEDTVNKLEMAAKEDAAFAEIWKNKALWDSLPINGSMAEIIAASDVAPEVIKWIHNNRNDASRIATMSPIMAAREISMIEAGIKYAPKPAPPKRVSAAPEPIQTINPATSNTVDEDDLPMEEYYRRRTKQLYGR